MLAQLLSALYALLMMAVIVGTTLQLQEDGIASPSGIFLLSLTASFIICGLLHPQEFNCLPAGFVYYLTVPSMYLLLIIYSVFNMNDVSWGTREDPKKVNQSGLTLTIRIPTYKHPCICEKKNLLARSRRRLIRKLRRRRRKRRSKTSL